MRRRFLRADLFLCAIITCGLSERAAASAPASGRAADEPSQSAQAPPAAAPPRLANVLDDRFQADSRPRYKVTGDVDWRPGSLELRDKCKLAVLLHAGPVVSVRLRATLARPRANGDRVTMCIRLVPTSLDSFAQSAVSIGSPVTLTVSRARCGPATVTTVRFDGADTQNYAGSIFGKFPGTVSRTHGLDDSDEIDWRLEYRHGLLVLITKGRTVTCGYVSNASAGVDGLEFQPSGTMVQLRELRVEAAPAARVPSWREKVELIRAWQWDMTANRLEEGAGNYREALSYRQKCANALETILGPDHDYTIQATSELALTLRLAGRYGQSDVVCRKLVSRCEAARGGDHPSTAAVYRDLADNLYSQGQYAQAEPLLQKCLDIERKARGEDHRATAAVYGSLAGIVNAQGKYAQAQPLLQKCLDIVRKTGEEDHPDTATSYNNVALNMDAQGQYARAEPLFQKALDIRRKALGEEHPNTARSYNDLAFNLNAQGQYARAQPLLQKALNIQRKTLGEDHPDTATSYINVARNLHAQGKFAQAEPQFQKALDIQRKTLGEDHPAMATSYDNVAANLSDQGKYAEAEPLLRKALDISREALGEDHPDTATSYNNLATNIYAQGRYAEAESFWTLGSDRFNATRLRLANAGLDRATKTGERSPLPALAAVLARNGKRPEAWRRYEESLARGIWDDLSARLSRPPAEQAKQAELVARLDRLDRLVEKATPSGEPSREQKKRRDDLLTQRRQAQDELDALAHELEVKYGPAAGQVFDRAAIQAGLPADAALIGWLDIAGAPKATDPDGEHWAFLLRAKGEPAVIRLKGTAPDGHWSDADTKLLADLRIALQSPSGDWQSLGDRMRKQRLEPLADQLAARDGLPAVRHLVVLPSTALAGVPTEAFADDFTVSYALSGTLYAHLHKQPKLQTAGLIALADPAFDRTVAPEPPRPAPPPGGVLVTSVVAGGQAAQVGLKAGDVMLRYNRVALTARDDLKILPESDDTTKRVAVTVWRDGKTLDKELRPGKLGVVLANDPAPQALAAKYEGDRVVAKLRGGDGDQWDSLPGTRVEAEGLRKLFAGSTTEPLLLEDSEASEQRLYDLAKSGELGKYRYLHLATHGTVDDRFPLRSALILSRDHLPDPDKQLDAGLPVFDGRLTAEEVLRQWHLNAELVTLSACQTALGKYERGEGYVGFAQVLILAGSRSVCLSLWKVDDMATALLMARFYENLLGKREGLKGPMGKAEALAEAKAWLRGLSREEAAQRAAKMSEGVARGKGPKRPPVATEEANPKGNAVGEAGHPYAHPYYWAAFVLIGDPE
jgi:tetratricopeptide (TPR) repeat protein